LAAAQADAKAAIELAPELLGARFLTRDFYAALGFRVVGRSPLDDGGRPFPLLHMRRPAASNAPAPHAR
jgi:hypothetical protein